jgi:chromosome segregation ATPase
MFFLDLDRLIDYQLTTVPDTTRIVNPRWRQLDSKARKQAAQLAKIKARFGALTLEGEMREGEVEGFLEKKNALKTEIESKQQDLENLKNQRREESRKIAISELPEEERFQALNNRSKHFVDTLKIVAYRAETALAQILAETMHAHHRDEARGLAQQIMATEANLRPDPEAGTLTVEIHSLSTPRDNTALENLCAELTETQTIYPGTKLRLIYKKVS